MEIINYEALHRCIRDAVREELQEHFKKGGSSPPQDERLLSKKELSEELGVSLATLTDWMKKGLPFLRLQKRCILKRATYSRSCNKKLKIKEGKMNIEFITKDDLKKLENLLYEIKGLLKSGQGQSKQWLKSYEVRKLLNISPGTLQNLAGEWNAPLHEDRRVALLQVRGY